jgi:S1-C subfamily serine protease
LLNKEGEVVGMNSASIPFAQGIGFSIPIDKAIHIGKELIEHGKVVRAWLGIFGVGVTKELAEYYNLNSNEGVLVTRVYTNSPAGLQGIVPGDIVLNVDGKKMGDMSELADYIREKKVGEEITLVVLRGDMKGEVSIKLAETPIFG